MNNQKPSRELIGLLKEHFVDELKQILLAYEKGDIEEVNRIVSEIDRYSYTALMMFKKSSNKEHPPFIEKDSMWEKYKARFLSEGYKGNSVDVLTAIFYWGLDKELSNSVDEQGVELKPRENLQKGNGFFEKLINKIKIFGNVTGSVFYMTFLLFNIIIGIVPAIWLLIEGGWLIVIIGILFISVSTFLIVVLTFPGLLFSAPFFLLSEKFAEKRKFSLSAFFYFVSTLYPSIIISIWSIVIFSTALNFSDEFSLLPLLLWSYIVALGPWMRLVKGDTSGSAMSISVFACASYLISIGIILLDLPLFLVSWAFILIMILGQIVISIALYRNIKKGSVYNQISHLL